MIKATIYVERLGGAYNKPLPSVELDAVPREGEVIFYSNSITSRKMLLKITKIKHRIETGEQGQGHKVEISCELIGKHAKQQT